MIPAGLDLSARTIKPGDRVLVNGPLGEHGAAILAARGEVELETAVESDSQPLNGLVAALLHAAPGHAPCRCDPRGIAAVLNEMAFAADVGVSIDEAARPLRSEVQGFCEILGSIRSTSPRGRPRRLVPDEQEQAALRACWGNPADARRGSSASRRRNGKASSR